MPINWINRVVDPEQMDLQRRLQMLSGQGDEAAPDALGALTSALGARPFSNPTPGPAAAASSAAAASGASGKPASPPSRLASAPAMGGALDTAPPPPGSFASNTSQAALDRFAASLRAILGNGR